MGSRSCSSELLRGLYARACGRLQVMRRLLVSTSHIIQAGNDLHIGINEACIYEQEEQGEIGAQKGRQRALARQVCGSASTGATAPMKRKPMDVDAINQVADVREQWKQVTFDCSTPFFLMAGKVSV